MWSVPRRNGKMGGSREGSGFSYWVACVSLECSKSKCLTVMFLMFVMFCCEVFFCGCWDWCFGLGWIPVEAVWNTSWIRLKPTSAHDFVRPSPTDRRFRGRWGSFFSKPEETPLGPIEYDGNTWKHLKTRHTYHNSPRISSLARGHSLHFVQRIFCAGDPSTQSNPQARPVECKPWLNQGYAPVTLQ